MISTDIGIKALKDAKLVSFKPALHFIARVIIFLGVLSTVNWVIGYFDGEYLVAHFAGALAGLFAWIMMRKDKPDA